MKRTILVVLAAVGGVLLFLTASFFVLSWAFFAPRPLPERVVLEVDLGEGLVESVPDDPVLLALERRRLRVRDVVEAVDEASRDERVTALLVRGGNGVPGWGVAGELREAVERFRDSGKPAVLFAETFGELSPGHVSYHLATAFDQVHLQPSGEVGLTPLFMEVPFLRGALDKLEVEPRFDRRWEYKDAPEILTERGFTPEARAAREAALASLEGVLVEGIAAGRGLSPDSARALLAGGPYPAREAEAAGLVDGRLYLDQVRDSLEARVEGPPERVGPREYLERSGRGWNRGPRVAVVYGVGSIHRGESRYDPFGGGTSLGAASVARAIREAAADRRVDAVLFRVNSPGGSWVASDQVRREIRRARDGGTPVVVSMGDVAASGGYVVSMDADRIVAQPGTFTGSIGVAGGRLVTREFWRSLGVEWDRVQVTDGGAFYSGVGDFPDEEWERFQLFLDRIYDDFVEGVARARGLDPETMDRVARGRIWTGAQARERGLVDGLGGFGTALDAVRELLELEPGAPLTVVTYPPERSLLQLLVEEGRRVRTGSPRSGGAGADLLALLRPLLRWGAEAGLVEGPGPVRAPPPGLPRR